MKIDDRPKQNAWAPGNYISEPCVHAKALRCRDTSVEDKRNCNSYECPYHPFTIE